ncbi:MAG: class I SAM-dependent methyltransferase [Bdellovibrionales bacterium]|nr:class I SAM-dependent methyltransferase [Bdellovibrionales bacterium]
MLCMFNCPLCQCSTTQPYCISDIQRSYFICKTCSLVFAEPHTALTPQDEKSRYNLHQNNLEEKGYREYLKKMWVPLYSHLKKLQTKLGRPLVGLDFGCGPTQAFQQFALELGIHVESYDPYFFAEQSVLEKKYDFIWCSEAFEHFNEPAGTISQIIQLLRTDGILAIRTELYPQADQFANWYYQRDPTHVSFYNESTMNWIALNWRLKLHLESNKVCFFNK